MNISYSFENRKTPSPERRMPYTDLLKQIMNDDNLDIHCMPAEIKNVKIQRIPSPLPFQRNIDKGNIDLDYVNVEISRNFKIDKIIDLYLCPNVF